MKPLKPHLQLIKGVWFCYLKGGIVVRTGMTPQDAYEWWHAASVKHSREPLLKLRGRKS